MKKIQQGFTLIELMIVVAIIGILAAIAIPAYQDYTVKSKASEGMTLAGAVQTAVAIAAAANGDISAATNATAAGADFLGVAQDTAITGNYVSKVTVVGTSAAGVMPQTASVTITYRSASATVPPNLAGKNLILNGTFSAGSVSWVVDGASTLAAKFQPKL